MWHARLHELGPVFYGVHTHADQTHVRPHDEDAVEKVEDDGNVRDYVVDQGLSRNTRQCHDDPVGAEEPGDEGAAQPQPGRQGNVDG